MSQPETATPPQQDAKFVSGSTMRHVTVMTLTSSIGLTALFFVDFADLYFISLLGEEEVAGAIGYGGAIIYFNISICVGLTIAIAALVSRAVGARRAEDARRLAASTVLYAILLTIGVAVVLWFLIVPILRLLGAQGEAFDYALAYARITIASLPLLGFGMCCNGILRAIGDAKLAMYTTLVGGIVNAALDPVFIFALDLGVDGAAWASVCARLAMALVGYWGVVRVHGFLSRPRFANLKRDAGDISKIAVPAMLTNIANPFGVAYVTATLARFGTDAVAASAIIHRIVPLAFGVVFSLSGAIGPIIGQNYGALRLDRARQAYMDAMKFAGLYVACVAALLFLLQDTIAQIFNASAGTTALIGVFCTFVAITWAFAGAQFVANASFNNLGKPHWSTLFNWGKATIGTVPFVFLGAQWAGAKGALIGMGVGSVVFGIITGLVGYALISSIARNPEPVRV